MEDGTLLYQTAIVDLTNRKRTEEAIRQSELRYRTCSTLCRWLFIRAMPKA